MQERAARAQPALYHLDADGWWLRHAPRCSWWVGATLPHGAVGAGELAGRVGEVEDFYAAHGTPARFQITPGVCPEGLDSLLAGRGYRREGPVSLRTAVTARVAEVPSPGALRVRVAEHPTRAWFDGWLAVQGHGADPGCEWDLLGRVESPSAYACALIGDEVVAVGRAVADTGWAGVFGMGTLPAARGRGAARSVPAALAGWAGATAAGRMYLQVERGNSAAMRLYVAAGFGEVSAYHYRVAD
ncbi:GNAT family N-acetyltransferase [Streptomyces sp. NPDC058691]|uniref:GNAT family N-acetyltransferase n=1 Tax=Streptomyces sp. NPDC058691 TaxID=3346601 RepID=UPI00364FD27F